MSVCHNFVGLECRTHVAFVFPASGRQAHQATVSSSTSGLGVVKHIIAAFGQRVLPHTQPFFLRGVFTRTQEEVWPVTLQLRILAITLQVRGVLRRRNLLFKRRGDNAGRLYADRPYSRTIPVTALDS